MANISEIAHSTNVQTVIMMKWIDAMTSCMLYAAAAFFCFFIAKRNTHLDFVWYFHWLFQLALTLRIKIKPTSEIVYIAVIIVHSCR